MKCSLHSPHPGHPHPGHPHPGHSSDSWKARLLIEKAREGHLDAQDELRWLHRPKMIRVVREMFPRCEHPRGPSRDLADQLLTRGFARLNEFEYRGTASLWPFLRARACAALLQLHRGGGEVESRAEEPRTGAVRCQEERSELEKELERDAFDRWMRITVGGRARRAILLRLNLGLGYVEIAGECRYRTAREARETIVDGLVGTVAAMARHHPTDARRWPLERRILATVDHPRPGSIDELLASHHLQRTRAAWLEERAWLSFPALVSQRFRMMIQRVSS